MKPERIDQSNSDYHDDHSFYSSSQVKTFADGPAMYNLRYNQGVRQSSSAFTLGSLVHAMVLEPDTLEDDYTLCPVKDRRTKAYKEWYAQADKSKTIVTATEWDTALNCTNAIHDHEISRTILEAAGDVETSWRYEADGIPCKLKADKVLPDQRMVFDLKTTQACTPRDVRSAFYKYKYGLQAAHYTVGAETCYGSDIPYTMIFGFVETQAPFRVLCYQIDHADLEQFYDRWRGLLQDLHHRSLTQDWAEPSANQLLTLELN